MSALAWCDTYHIRSMRWQVVPQIFQVKLEFPVPYQWSVRPAGTVVDGIGRHAAAISAGVGSVGLCAIVFTKDSFLFLSSAITTTTDTARPKGRGVRGEMGVTKDTRDGHQVRCPWWFCPWRIMTPISTHDTRSCSWL